MLVERLFDVSKEFRKPDYEFPLNSIFPYKDIFYDFFLILENRG